MVSKTAIGSESVLSVACACKQEVDVVFDVTSLTGSSEEMIVIYMQLD